MAIYHFSAKMVSRSGGKSIVAKAAYNARAALTEERTGEAKDYRRAKGLLFSGLYTPAKAPTWAHDRAQLWNAADAAEKRKDAQVAREYQMALPHELTDEQRRYLVQDFVKESFTRKGYVADVCLHAPDREGDQRNFHAHILVTDRRLEAQGFAPDKKERQQNATARKADLEALREKWEHHANRHLERYGHAARIDRRSLKDQGSDREPTQHLGPYATQLERDGEESERGNANRDIEARNQERKEAQREYETAQADREQWEEKIAQGAIQKAEEDQKKEREAEQDIDARLAGKEQLDKNSLERKLEENNVPFFGRLKERVKQFIGHKIDEHKAEKQKEKLHKTIIEKEWRNQEREEARQARQDKAHDCSRSIVEIRQAETREKMGFKAPERDEALKAAQKTAQRTNTEKSFRGLAEETTGERIGGLPTERAEERLSEWSNKPAKPKERDESTLDKTIRAVGKGREAVGKAGREAKKSIRVLDKATGVATGVSNGAAAILDGIARPVEAFAEGIANMFGGASPADERKTSLERTLQAMEERAAREEALENICESLKGGDDISAADLRNLPRAELERIRDGGDEYLQNMARQFERERDDWGRERER